MFTKFQKVFKVGDGIVFISTAKINDRSKAMDFMTDSLERETKWFGCKKADLKTDLLLDF